MDKEPLEVMVARIDERVNAIHQHLPVMSQKLDRHDVILAVLLCFAVLKFPWIAEVFAKWAP